MIKIARVRHAPKTGLGNTKRKSLGVVYFDGQWLGDEVVIFTADEYRTLTKYNRISEHTHRQQIKSLQSRLKRIQRLAQ